MNRNSNKFRSKFHNAVQTANHYGKRAAAGGTALMASGAAFAQGVGADVEAAIDEQKTIALAVAAAGTIAILIVKYSKLARRG